MRKKIIFSLIFLILIISCKEKELSQNERNILIDNLKSKLIKPCFNGKVYGDFVILKQNKTEIYLWATLQEFYDGKITNQEGEGISIPVKVNIKGRPITNQNIISIEKPRNENQVIYVDDISKTFPKELHKTIFNFPSSKTLMFMRTGLKEDANKNLPE